ncbi:MAG: c-type cytochrome [Gammaproteobacteria bacterium]
MTKTSFKIMSIVLLAISGLLGFVISLYVHGKRPTEAPQVIQTFHYPATFVKQLSGDPKAGEKIFKEFCGSCHNKKPLIDIHAPRIGDKKIWQGLQQVGMSTLLNITIKGAGAMPARGGCFECSDEQLRLAIQYILDESK